MVLHPLIIGLLLLAALMHASWHAILKSDHSDRLATFGVIKGVGLAMALCAMPFLPSLEPAAWTYLMVSVPIHLLYFTFLLRAYSYGDLSHTFPIARGISPLLVLLASGHLTGEQLRPQGVAGVVLMSAGVIALALLKRPAAPTPAGRHGLATLFAILSGITIAAYIVVDGLGVRSAGPTPLHWLAYIVWLYVLEGPWLFLLAMCLRPDTIWPHLRAHWWRGAVGGVIANVSYGIAIFALALAPMAHVAALRETTVLFGALIGVLLLHEPFGTQRVAAAVVIVVGLVLLNGPTLFQW